MQKIIDFIASKSVTDTSMAMALKMIKENVAMQEDCILALFQSMYEANKLLAEEVLKHRSKKTIILQDSKIS